MFAGQRSPIRTSPGAHRLAGGPLSIAGAALLLAGILLLLVLRKRRVMSTMITTSSAANSGSTTDRLYNAVQAGSGPDARRSPPAFAALRTFKVV
ncbi:hypothetical protein AB0H34_30550 [Saccharopolyspora shandongensis]|uniref:hypothetical protein n=1 Tax=Saccharopolyspora shandongensis TaxID=418495 RepID=UPI0033E983CE